MSYTTQGVIGLNGQALGKILDVDIANGSWIVQKSGYVALETSVRVDMALQKRMGSMLFGVEGLILQWLSGTGMALIFGYGDLNVVDLKPGGTDQVVHGQRCSVGGNRQV